MGVGYPGGAFFEDMGPVKEGQRDNSTEEENKYSNMDLTCKLKSTLSNLYSAATISGGYGPAIPISKEEYDEGKKKQHELDIKFIETLWQRINIDKDRQKSIEKNGNSLLVLYYLIKECGADKDWQESYDFYENKDYTKDPNDIYICDSQYNAYFAFQYLKKEIQKIVGIEGVKGIRYSEYIKSCISDLTENKK